MVIRNFDCKNRQNEECDMMDKLLKSSIITNQALYFSILDDAATCRNCADDFPALLADVPELRMDIKFILVDLQTIMTSCYKADRFYEKRYHLKNLYAGMLEGYKLLYGFGKIRRHTIWARMGEHFKEYMETCEDRFVSLAALRNKYDEITQSLLNIETTISDRDDRNLTYHYDDDLLLVYRLTLKMDSEDRAGLKFIEYMQVLKPMLELCNEIEEVFDKLGLKLPESEGRHDELALMIVQEVAKLLRQHPTLPEVLEKAIDQGATQIDSYAKIKKDALTFEDFIGDSINNKIISIPDLPEIGIIKGLADVQMMVSFMMADSATILRGFIGADSNVEHPLLLRRLTVSRVSTLNHLISYRSDVSDSMMARVLKVIPAKRRDLINKGQVIKDKLIRLCRPGDLDTRALYVHLIDNKKYMSNVPAIVKALENPAILEELQAFVGVMKICGDISQFLTEIMSALAENAKKERAKSERELKKQIKKIRNVTNLPHFPELLKGNLRAQMDEIEKLLMSEGKDVK